MKPSLQLKLGQQLTMTPQLQQAIRLLQLSAVDLQTEIQAALESNTMLELDETDIFEENLTQTDEQESLPQNAQSDEEDESQVRTWENSSLRQASFNESSGNEIESLNANAHSLKDHLLWQMQLTPFSDTDRQIATIIIDAINEDGFLTCSIEEILATVKQVTDVDKGEIEAVLHHIQQFDPLGVGARDLSECLKVQLDFLPAFALRDKARELICNYLELLGKRDYPTLRRRLRLSSEQLREVIHCIQSLNPRPGNQIGSRSPEYLVPDLYAYKRYGKWIVELNPECTPHLQINRYYSSLIRRSDSSAQNQFLRNQLQEARWFLKSIENRNETLLKVAYCIIEQQQGFLEYGEEAMKPLILHDVAKALEMHDSTISRVTTQKYLHTPRGTFELKYFFSSHVATEEGGECSGVAIRALIKKLIGSEDPKKPYSDSKLSKILATQGIKIARRTVTKYREALSIAPSCKRKILF